MPRVQMLRFYGSHYGWRAMCRIALLLTGVLGTTAVAASWFKNDEQLAAADFEQGEYSEAAEGFEDNYRRGVSLYRAGRYTEAGEAFASVEREEVKADALYNLGNTRYKRSDFEGAVDAYEASLELRTTDEDTLHNLALAKKKVEQILTEELQEEPVEEPEEEEQESEEESSGEEEQESEESSGEQEQESEESSGE